MSCTCLHLQKSMHFARKFITNLACISCLCQTHGCQIQRNLNLVILFCHLHAVLLLRVQYPQTNISSACHIEIITRVVGNTQPPLGESGPAAPTLTYRGIGRLLVLEIHSAFCLSAVVSLPLTVSFLR